MAYRPPYSTVPTEILVSPLRADSVGGGETEGNCEQPYVAEVGAGDLFMVAQDGGAVVLDTGATANLVGYSWLARQNRILERRGTLRATTLPSKATFRFGDGRLGEERHAADIPVGNTGNRGMFPAFALDGDVPALLPKGALESLGGQLEFLRGSLNLH